jgi:subtilisin family serine protease
VLSGLKLLCGLLPSLLLVAPLNAEPLAPEAVFTSTRAARFDKLIPKATRNGSLPVIIRLNIDFEPEGKLEAKVAGQQRSAIAQARETLLSKLSRFRPQQVKPFAAIPYFAIRLGPEALQFLRTLPEVVTIEEDQLNAPSLYESVPLVGGTGAFQQGFTGSGWAVAVLDSGVDKNHPFLSGKVVSEACYSTTASNGSSYSLCPGGVSASTSPDSGLDCSTNISGCGHGTHVAGIAAGKSSDFSGVAKDASLIAVQVFSTLPDQVSCDPRPAPCIGAYNSDIIKGLERVLELSSSFKIAAANMSLGGGYYQSYCDIEQGASKAAIDNLLSADIVTVIASGNASYIDAIGYPACVSSAVSVGSTTKSDTVSSFSNSASILTLLAPGEAINSSEPNGQFATNSGTSMAAPHVAGAMAILRQKAPTAGVDALVEALVNSGVPITDPRNGITKNRIQVDSALSLLSGSISSNDNFADAQQLSGASATVTANSANATKETGEPDHAGNLGGKSLWWSWTAAVSGNVTVSTSGSDFDTLLGVYTGSAVNALVEVASNDDENLGADIFTSLITFNATAGVTYRIAVDGYSADAGNISLSLVNNGSGGNPSILKGDFNADGKADILWRNRVTGQNLLWLMSSTTVSSFVSIPLAPDLNWIIGGTADYSGDGKTDILWRNGATGQNSIWIMNDTTLSSTVTIDPAVGDPNWQIVGTGDFSDDGKPDILWRNKATGANTIWIMDGLAYSSPVTVNPVSDLNWEIGGAADYSGDGKPDILWRNKATGANTIWIMDGLAYSSPVTVNPESDLNWEIRGPR